MSGIEKKPYSFSFSSSSSSSSFDLNQLTYISRIHETIYLVQSPIPPGQLSPELLPNKFNLHHLQNGLNLLKQSQLNQLLSIPSKSIPMDPSIQTQDLTSIDQQQQQQQQQQQANITNEQITFDQLSQLPENTPTIISEEEFHAFFRILNAANQQEDIIQNQSDHQLITSVIEDNIPVEVSISSNKSNKRSRNNHTPQQDRNNHNNIDDDLPKSDKKIRRTTATFSQKIEVLNWYHANGESQTGTAKHFDKIYPELRIKQPLVSAWVKDELHIRALAPPGSSTAKRVRGTTHPEVTTMLEEWVQQAILAKINITGDVICEKWKHFAQLCGIPPAEWLTLSHGWLDAFRQRNGLRHFKPIPDIPITSKPQPESDLARLTTIISQYPPEDVYNMDETGLFYAMPPDKELAEQQGEEGKQIKVHDQGGVIEDTKQVKSKLTIALACNSDGSDRLPPLFIGKTEQPTLSNPITFEQQTGFEYRQNSKTMMTSSIFQQWILSWNQKLSHQNRSILLLIDNFVGHVLPSVKLDSIRVEFFSSNVQPFTVGIIQSFKSNYRRRFTSRAIRRFDEVPASEIYSIDPVTAMRLCRAAWNAVPIQIIQTAWTNTGLIKLEPIEPLLENDSQLDEPELNSDLQVLQDIGVLTPENRMQINEILEPIGESSTDTRLWTPEEIFHHTRSQSQQSQSTQTQPIQFQSQSKTQQVPTQQTQSVQPVQTSIPIPIPTSPTQIQPNSEPPAIEEALKSIKTIIKFLEVDDTIEGQNLEPLLESFYRRLNDKTKQTSNEKSLPQIG